MFEVEHLIWECLARLSIFVDKVKQAVTLDLRHCEQLFSSMKYNFNGKYFWNSIKTIQLVEKIVDIVVLVC